MLAENEVEVSVSLFIKIHIMATEFVADLQFAVEKRFKRIGDASYTLFAYLSYNKQRGRESGVKIEFPLDEGSKQFLGIETHAGFDAVGALLGRIEGKVIGGIIGR